jgi:osmotically-inducible protein OsmY
MEVVMYLSDEEIRNNVLEQFKWDARFKPTEIGVTANAGVITLVGTVDGYTKKWAAEEAALRIRGVKAVANELEVGLPELHRRSDADIARDAMLALTLAIDLPEDLKVSVDKGWLTLSGEVEWYYQKYEAETKVRDIKGVKNVSNQITVNPMAQPDQLKKLIEDALVRTAETDAENIEVEVNDSQVTLKGRVHSWYEKEEAKREAWLAPGVSEVVDRLEITP